MPAQAQAAPKHPTPAWRQVTTCTYVELPAGQKPSETICTTTIVHRSKYVPPKHSY
jgi:hypothetical protein